MSNILKEAIADAKTVRETAIANAKMALEEAFTPHLKSMLSAKLAEDEVEEGYDEVTAEEMEDEEDEDMDEMGGKYREDDDEEMEMDEMGHEEDEEDVEEGIIEINGVKYAPVVEGEHEDEEEDPEEGYHKREDDDEDMEEDLDLEAVIKELETEIAEAEESDEDSVNEGEDEDEKDEVDEEIVVEEEDEDEDKVDEQSKSSGIGAGDNKVTQASAGDEEDPGKGKIKESVKAMQKELNEYKEAVTFLREKLHEVNILNAKLLYTNRLFKEYVLSNDQKLKIVETFDRAQTTREIKLVYSTLAESFKNGDIKKGRVQESASTKTGTTKPTQKIITEENQVADRFKKLAGIL